MLLRILQLAKEVDPNPALGDNGLTVINKGNKMSSFDSPQAIKSVARQFLRGMVECQADMFMDLSYEEAREFNPPSEADIRLQASEMAKDVLADFVLSVMEQIRDIPFKATFELELMAVPTFPEEN